MFYTIVTSLFIAYHITIIMIVLTQERYLLLFPEKLFGIV